MKLFSAIDLSFFSQRIFYNMHCHPWTRMKKRTMTMIGMTNILFKLSFLFFVAPSKTVDDNFSPHHKISFYQWCDRSAFRYAYKFYEAILHSISLTYSLTAILRTRAEYIYLLYDILLRYLSGGFFFRFLGSYTPLFNVIWIKKIEEWCCR